MRLAAALMCLALASPAFGLTIDFEQFEPGPLPATYPTPWGDIAFLGGAVRENPLGPGTRMAYGFEVDGAAIEGEIGSLHILFPITLSALEATFVFVNLNPEPRSLEGLELDQDGDPAQDFGIFVPAEGTRSRTFTFDHALPGLIFLGVVNDLTESDRCIGAYTTCNDLWGIDSITISPIPIPEPATALLLGAGFAGMTSSRRSARRARPRP